MCKVIATDLDGTLFYPKRTRRLISSKSVRFLRKFIDAGNRVVCVTGRNIRANNLIIKRLKRPVDFIGCNSSFIVHDGKKIKDDYFNPNDINPVIEYLESHYKLRAVWLMSEEKEFLSKYNFDTLFYYIGYNLWSFFQGVYNDKFTISKTGFINEINHGKVYKIMVMFGLGEKNKERAKQANKELREVFKDSVEFSWSGEMIEITPKGCSKANGLKFYEEYFNINHSDIYVVGDSGNDISMFNEYKENSFCMAHAPLSVSKYASHTLKKFKDLENYVMKKEGKIDE